MPHLRKPSHLRKIRGMDEEISHRILLLSSFIVVIFLVVFIRLIYIQVFSYNDYVQKKDDYTSIRQYVNAPRGQIYDCKGRVLAKTVVSHNIVYTSPKNMSSEDYKLYAKRLVEVFNIDTDDFSETDKKEAYITWKSFLSPSNSEYAANNLLTKPELNAYKSGLWGTNAETRRHQILMKRIGKKQIKEMSAKQLKIAVIYQRMTENASTGQENVILEDVGDDDVAYLVEHKSDFPGFDVDFGGWKREYPYGETLSDVLGTVSTSTQGLPSENANYYLQRGFQYNATVGKSGLEYEYNDVLSGQAQVSKITYDSNGLAKKTVVQSAVKGDDVYLSIDIDLQQKLDETVKSVLQEKGGSTNRENFSTLFMCMMDPNSGSVLAMSGYQKDLDSGKMTYFASGCYASLANPGSSVKGATVYMGLSEGAVKPGEIIVDQTMNIGGQEFSSYEDHGPVDDIQALAVSSNVYMFNIAIRLGGDTYKEGESLHINDVTGTLNKMRSYYSMFGLGNKTGLDVPDEVSGYMGVGFEPGMLLNYAIGQMDMYTPVQLMEYVSTIATGGKMYQPSLMKYIKEVNSDQVIQTGGGVLKSTLPEKNKAYLNRVQQGFRAVVSEGNASDDLQNMDVEVAGKTGTAEVNQWTTAVFVGYAPYENPTVSFACVAPTSSVNSQSVSENTCTYDVVPTVLEKYFELYPAS
ncbi:MAG: penicillin-binding protein 2 [Absicoccus porci]|uniref:peptidoglycan D,D-transpeptidase FtsI family protein n=1 Tax=Absicoccus porci TaxID=2486576 RepID=UPI002E7A9939|nr:penicillin-binding protein 2 [Absicoccus porci]MEE1354380.1 penicillin-binding protein 2 [Absicoccus porci]